MIKRRNPTEKEIAKVVHELYAYGTDFPGRIAQKLYDMGYRRVDTTPDTGYTEGNNETTEV